MQVGMQMHRDGEWANYGSFNNFLHRSFMDYFCNSFINSYDYNN